MEEVVSKGEADRAGVMVGDVMTRCSAVTLKDGSREGEQEGYGERLYNNWETVMFDCKDQDFKTVMTALKSNNARWGILDVTMEFRRDNSAESGAAA